MRAIAAKSAKCARMAGRFCVFCFAIAGAANPLLDEALQAAKRQGKIKPSQIDGFIYDTGRHVGAANGGVTTKIKIHVSPDGKRLHAFPWQ